MPQAQSLCPPARERHAFSLEPTPSLTELPLGSEGRGIPYIAHMHTLITSPPPHYSLSLNSTPLFKSLDGNQWLTLGNYVPSGLRPSRLCRGAVPVAELRSGEPRGSLRCAGFSGVCRSAPKLYGVPPLPGSPEAVCCSQLHTPVCNCFHQLPSF